MIVDFQHHFTPRELIKEDPGDRLILHYDAQGAPSYTIHKLLYDLDEHVRMMDAAGIDAAWLTSAAGMCADLDKSRLCNDTAKKAERDYPGRFIGAAHANPLGGAAVQCHHACRAGQHPWSPGGGHCACPSSGRVCLCRKPRVEYGRGRGGTCFCRRRKHACRVCDR